MRALVVDDEPLVRSELVYALGRVAGEFEISEASDASQALAILADADVDVLFLDIKLPGLSGIDAMKVIAKMSRAPEVVFVTADEKHAVDAFTLAAADYVVKPVSEARLAVTVERLRARRTGAAGTGGATPSAALRLPLDDDGKTRLVKPSEIRFVQASGHVVSARLYDGDLRWRGTLGECAQRLEPLGFLRCHRAYLVNPDHVVEVEPFFGGAYLLRVDDKARSEVPVSRGFMPMVRKTFGL